MTGDSRSAVDCSGPLTAFRPAGTRVGECTAQMEASGLHAKTSQARIALRPYATRYSDPLWLPNSITSVLRTLRFRPSEETAKPETSGSEDREHLEVKEAPGRTKMVKYESNRFNIFCFGNAMSCATIHEWHHLGNVERGWSRELRGSLLDTQ